MLASILGNSFSLVAVLARFALSPLSLLSQKNFPLGLPIGWQRLGKIFGG
jgi:hypothetical protein